MKKILKNKKAYSIVVIIIIIGFLTVLTAGVFKLIMNEMKDNRTIGNYIKAYAGAESAQELALLEIKEKGYESDKEMDRAINISTFLEETKNNKDVYISYKRDLKTDKLEDKTLKSGETVLIPLFYLDSTKIPYEEKGIKNMVISENGTSVGEDVSWNIIGEKDGISGNGANFNAGKVKIVEKKGSGLDEYYEFKLTDSNVRDFLDKSTQNYLQMVNGAGTDFNYEINLLSGGEISKPVSKIISTGESGDYRTNIETEIDFSKMNDFSKYSIFSP